MEHQEHQRASSESETGRAHNNAPKHLTVQMTSPSGIFFFFFFFKSVYCWWYFTEYTSTDSGTVQKSFLSRSASQHYDSWVTVPNSAWLFVQQKSVVPGIHNLWDMSNCWLSVFGSGQPGDFSWKHKCGASLTERHISQKYLIPYLLRNKSDLASWHSSHWKWSHEHQDQLEMHLRSTRDELVYVALWTRDELVYVAGRRNTSEEPGNMANPASKHYCRWKGR